jgi:rubrerythrin
MASEAAHEVYRVVHACRDIELAMAGLYRALAEIHDYQPAIARMWRKTAREEDNHAAQFSLLLDAMPDAADRPAVDVRALDRLRQAIESTIEEFRLRSPSLREALVAVIDFEESMDHIHANHALVFTDSRCKRMFTAMMAADAGHVSQLRAALGRLG